MGTLQSIFFKPSRGYRKYKPSGITSALSEGTYVPSEEIKPYSEVSDTLYRLDGVISEQHSSTAKITKHPVEYGVDISDYVIKQPMKVIVNGIVTNSPFVTQLVNRLPGDPSFMSVKKALSGITGSRVRNAYKGLINLQNERQPVSLQTGLLVYDNMVLTDVSAPNDLEGNLKVRLTFEEIFVVSGSKTGATEAITNKPSDIDTVTALKFIGGLGLIGSGVFIN